MKMQKVWVPLAGVAAMLCLGVWTGTALAAPLSKPCETNGPMGVTTPDSYTYVQDADGGTSRSFTVSSPTGTKPNDCKINLGYTFGNTGSDTIAVNVVITKVTYEDHDEDLPDIKSAVVAALSFTPDEIPDFTPPGTGSRSVSFTFTNSSAIPVGNYDVYIEAQSPGTGVGTGTTTFTLEVTEPTAVDSLAPRVTIQSPTNRPSIVVNGILAVSFTANDPDEDGVGTGVTSVAASIKSSNPNPAVDEDITSDLAVDPSPSLAVPVPAGTDVSATADIQMTEIGSYTLTAEATDGVGRTGSFLESFTVHVNKTCLPPVSMSGRVFKSGSTVPVKWAFTDANEAFLPPYASIKVTISGLTASGPTAVTAGAGNGASNIRWELDSAGHATQYMVNFPIPATAEGLYKATISVEDVDGNETEQGTCPFMVSPKGGKM